VAASSGEREVEAGMMGSEVVGGVKGMLGR